MRLFLSLLNKLKSRRFVKRNESVTVFRRIDKPRKMNTVVDEEIDDFGELIESSLSRKRTPLTKLSVLIGQKHLNFKIVDKSTAKEKESSSKPTSDKPLIKSFNKRRPVRSKVSFVDQDEDYEEEDESPPIKRRPVPRKRGAISNYYTTPPPAQTYLTSLAYDSAARSNPNNGEILPMPPPPAPSTRASDDAEFNCMFCGCCFESADDLTEHEPQCAAGETESMNISCHCGRTFINIDALDSHSRVHEVDIVPPGTANFHCRYCGKSFGTALSLATHEAVHSSSLKPFRCSYCNKAFLKKSELMLHERIHGEEETEFNCSVCGKNFTSRMKLSRHEVMHSASGQKPFSCTYCGKTFAHHQSLQKHERGHTGEKPFQCPICTKCFAAQSNYDVHMKLHASGRRFFCSFCGKWFRTEHQMLEHQQNCLAHLHGQNTGDGKPLRYQCSFCEKMFHYRRDQLIHERTHTGERPYTCGYCNKGFTQSQALTIHIRTHTGERPYMCEVCGCDFRDSSSLRKHEFIRHPSINPHFVGAMPLQRPLFISQEDDDQGDQIDITAINF